jgi:hypothetical protein
MAARKAPDDFSIWFALQNHASEGRWEDMVNILRRGSCPRVVRHPFTIKAFGDAASAGQDSVVRLMLRRGFTLGPRDAPFMIAAAAEGSPCPGKIKIAAEILRTSGADCAALAKSFAQSGNTSALILLHTAGSDVGAAGKSMHAAFVNGHARTMEALAHCGVSIYSDNIISELRKPNQLSDAQTRADMLQHWKVLAARDAQTMELLRAFKALGAAQLDADTLLRPRNAQGLTLLAVLAAHDKLSEVFVPARWTAQPQDAQKVHQALAAFNALDCVDFNLFSVRLRQEIMQSRARDGARFRL